MIRTRPLIVLLFLAIPRLAVAADIESERARMEALTRELTKGEAIELKTLEIRARIYEPSVIYILDRARLEVDYGEAAVRFESRIADPILENRF